MKQPILDGILESDLDLNHFGFVNFDGLLGTFQAHSNVLDALADTSPSYVGLSILQLANPGSDSFLKIQSSGVPVYVAASSFEAPLTFNAPLSRSGNTISIPAATGSVNGYLTSADWTTFNSKQPSSSNLTSWAAISRASGFDTFAATPSLANFKSLLSDETTVVGSLLSLANPSVISFIKIAADNTVSTRTPLQLLGDIAAEPALGNPGTNGFLLSSTTGGVRSWVAGLTNSAGNNIIPKSNGTNLVASGIDDDGNSIHLIPENFPTKASLTLSGNSNYALLSTDSASVKVNSNKIEFIADETFGGSGFKVNGNNLRFGAGGTVQYQDGVLALAGFSSITGRIGSANLPLGAQLYDNAGTPKLSADFYARELYDGGEVESVDWQNRYLFAPDGTTIAMNWSSPTEIGFFGGNVTIDSGGYMSVNLWDGNLIALNPVARQLIANDGSAVALDWSDPTQIMAFGGSKLLINSDGASDINAGSAIKINDVGNSAQFGYQLGTLVGFCPDSNIKIGSNDGNTYFDNTGFHGIGSVIAGTKTATGTATTTFTVTIGVTMANNTYKVTTEGDNALSSAVHYVNNKTTTSFDIVYLAGLTGAVSIDWIVSA